jgi:hypothetical protein
MNSVANWEPRFVAIGADGFFKAIIRRHPSTVCWSWAIEWNQQYRIVGFFGEREPAESIVNTFPYLEAVTLAQGPDQYLRARKEKKLDNEDDILFLYNAVASSE